MIFHQWSSNLKYKKFSTINKLLLQQKLWKDFKKTIHTLAPHWFKQSRASLWQTFKWAFNPFKGPDQEHPESLWIQKIKACIILSLVALSLIFFSFWFFVFPFMLKAAALVMVVLTTSLWKEFLFKARLNCSTENIHKSIK